MFLAFVFRLLLGSYSAIQIVSSARSPPKPRSPVFPPTDSSKQICFTSRPIDHHVCVLPLLPSDNLQPVVLTFTYSCKWKRTHTKWSQFSSNKPVTVIIEQKPGLPLAYNNPKLANGVVENVEGCSTCLRFTRLVEPDVDRGTYFVNIFVLDDNGQQGEFTSHSSNIIIYDDKDCPHLTSNPLSASVRSEPLTSDTLVSVDDTIDVEFSIPSRDLIRKESLCVVQEDFAFVRSCIPYTCDTAAADKCSATVKVGGRSIPKLFHVDDESTNVQIILSLRYKEMEPIVFRRDFKLTNPNFKKSQR